MPEWLRLVRDEIWEAFPNGLNLTFRVLALRLAVAFVLGCAVAAVYRLTRGRHTADTGNLVPTLVLLTVLIAMVTLAIGNSLARAFGLVGALSIVRFRTIVEDTRDTAFVIFAVGVGMGVGAGFLAVPVVGLVVAGAAALLFRPGKAPAPHDSGTHLLTVRVGVGHDPDTLLRKAFETHLRRWDLTAAATARQGAAVDFTYAVRLRQEGAAVPLVAQLNGLEGIQSVELRQA